MSIRCCLLSLFALSVVLSSFVSSFASPPAAKPPDITHFSYRPEVRFGSSMGIVTAYEMDLFAIPSAAGGYDPLSRARMVSERLNELMSSHHLTPEMFSVGFRNGEVIIQQQEHTAHLPHIIVTIDRKLARNIEGTKGKVELLANWWLALLRDRLAIAIGRPPIHTAGTQINTSLEMLYRLLGEPDEEVEAGKIAAAMELLSPIDKEMLRQACWRVPENYDPDRYIVVYASRAKGGTQKEEDADHNDEHEKKKVAHSRTTHKETPTDKPANHEKEDEHEAGTESHIRIALHLDPEEPVAKKPVDLIINVADMNEKAEDKSSAVEHVLIRGAIYRKGEDAPVASLRNPGPGDKPGEYKFTFIFPAQGEYHLKVVVVTDSLETAKKEFPVLVKATRVEKSTEESEENSTSAEPGRESITPIPRSLIDYVTWRTIPRGTNEYLEIVWKRDSPRPLSVTFALLDKDGRSLEEKKIASPPFTASLKRVSNVANAHIVAEYEGGIIRMFTIPAGLIK